MIAALIVANEEEKAAAAPLLGEKYAIYCIGEDADFAGRSVLIWPNGHDLSELAQTIAKLPRESGQSVKLLPGDKQPSDFTQYDDLIQWAKQHVRPVEPNSPALAVCGEPTHSPVADPEAPPPPGDVSGLAPADDYPDAGEPDLEPPPDFPAFIDDPDGEREAYIVPHLTWAEPLDLTSSLYRGRKFAKGMVPEVIEAYASEESRRLGTDMGISVLSALAACSGFASDHIKLQVHYRDPRWLVRPCIWCLPIGESSAGKTPAIQGPMLIVQKMDAELGRENVEKLEAYNYAMKQYAIAEAEALKNKQPKPESPPKPDLKDVWFEKGTMEGLRDMLSYTTRGVLWYREELAGAIAEFDRYNAGKKGGSGDRQLFLQLFDGGPSKIVLSKYQQTVVENWSATLLGGTQPSAIIKYCGDLQGDGLLQRTLICMARDKRPGLDETPNYAPEQAFRKVLRTLFEHHGECVVKMSEEAAAIREKFVRHVALLIKYEQNPNLASHMGKWEGYCSRLMLLYHLIDLAAQGQQPGPNERISAKTAQQVVDFFMQWQLSHVQEFWNELMSERVERSFAQEIARDILYFSDRQEWALRDFYKNHPRWGKMKPWERKEAINTLILSEWLTPKGSKKNSDGMYTHYLRNPLVISRFAEEAEEEKRAREERRAQMQAMRAEFEES